MKFYKGQKVACIGESNEFNPTLSDFNRSLQIALGNETVPIKDQIYTVTNPFSLHYNGKCYIEISGFGGTSIDESAFKPLQKVCRNEAVDKLTLSN